MCPTTYTFSCVIISADHVIKIVAVVLVADIFEIGVYPCTYVINTRAQRHDRTTIRLDGKEFGKDSG